MEVSAIEGQNLKEIEEKFDGGCRIVVVWMYKYAFEYL